MIKVLKITKIYKSGRGKVRSLDDVTIEFPEKGMVFVVGPSGAGKSTLLNLIGLHDTPTSGEILVDGISVKGLSAKRLSELRNGYFSFMRQDGDLISRLSVYENLSIALRIQGKTISREEAALALSSLGLQEDVLDEFPENLSGGQRQRVSFARGILKGCKAILADEPTSSLDGPNEEKILSMLKEASKEKLVVIVCHSRKQAENYADGIIELEEGKMILDSSHCPVSSDGGEPLKGRKLRFPIKDRLSFALSSFSGLIGRAMFSGLSLSLALMTLMGGISSRIIDLDQDILISSLISETKLGRVSKSLVVSAYLSQALSFSESEAATIEEAYDGNCLFFGEYGLNGLKDVGGVETTKDYTVLSYESLDQYGLALIGSLPEKENEIAVTAYSSYLYGWFETPYESNQKIEAVLGEGKTLIAPRLSPYDDYEYTVTGIVITDLPKEPSKGAIEEEIYQAAIECELHQTAFLSQEGYSLASFYGGEEGRYSSYAYPLNKNNLKISSDLIPSLYQGEGEILVKDLTRLTPAIKSLKGLLSGASDVFAVATSLFSIIYILCLATFLSSSIEKERKTMMTLKSLGVDDFGLYSILAFETLTMGLGSFVLGSALYIGLAYGTKAYLSSIGYPVAPNLLTYFPFVLGFASVIVISLLLSYLFSKISFKRKRIV